MKTFLFAFVVCSLAFFSCESPSSTTTTTPIPSDSIMDSGQPAPDSARKDTTHS